MEEPFSRSGNLAVKLSSQNALASNPEIDPSESGGFRAFGIVFQNGNEVLASESDEDNRSIISQTPPVDDVVIHETDSSENESSQASVNEYVVDREIYIAETPSQSDQENTPNHSQGLQNEAPQLPYLFSVQNVPANLSQYSTRSNNSEDEVHTSFDHEEIISETESSESGDSQASENNCILDEEVNIPESPSQSDQENTPNQSRTSYQLSVQSPSAASPVSPTNYSGFFGHSSNSEAAEAAQPVDDVIIHETDPGESDNSQGSANELLIENEVNIPETPSQSDQESTPAHSQVLQNGSPQTPSHCSVRHSSAISPANVSVSSPANDPEVQNLSIGNVLVYETDDSDNENRQANGNIILMDSELSIPETPSQSDQENTPAHSQVLQNESSQSPHRFSVQHSPANIGGSSARSTNFEDEQYISPVHEEIIHETEPSESENSQASDNEFVVDAEMSIPETPSQSDQENTPAHSQGLQNELSQSPNSFSVRRHFSLLPINSSNVSSPANEPEVQNLSIGHVLVYETDDSDNDYSQASGNNFLLDSELSIPETPSVSDDEDLSNHSENELLHTSNHSPIPNPPLTFDDDMRLSNLSPDLFDDDDIPDDLLNVAEGNTGTPTGANLSVVLNENVPNESQDVDVIPPSIDSALPFVLPALLRNNHENDTPLDDPVEIGSSSESDADDEDDDETILRIENSPIQISEQSRAIIERIERFISGVLNDMRNGNRIQIIVQNRRSWANCLMENERFSLLPISDARCRHIRSTFNLSVIFYVLGEIHELLSTNRTCTIRELYYKDVNLTQKQENVSEALKTVCCILDATPWELGVLSTSKGLIAGPLQIQLPDNSVIDCSIDRNGMTLPHLTAGIVDIRTTATHILLVEKDTVFKKLLQNNIIGRWNNKCILITGKGYPDTNTRLILVKLRELHALPINVFTDADPYGIEIMLTYRHGSLNMSNLAESLAVPSVRWLGIFPSDIRKFGINSIPLTADDKRKLDNILNRPFINDHVHRELLIMKQANVKAEIEGISDSSCTYLIDVYLCNKIDNNDGI